MNLGALIVIDIQRSHINHPLGLTRPSYPTLNNWWVDVKINHPLIINLPFASHYICYIILKTQKIQILYYEKPRLTVSCGTVTASCEFTMASLHPAMGSFMVSRELAGEQKFWYSALWKSSPRYIPGYYSKPSPINISHNSWGFNQLGFQSSYKVPKRWKVLRRKGIL